MDGLRDPAHAQGGTASRLKPLDFVLKTWRIWFFFAQNGADFVYILFEFREFRKLTGARAATAGRRPPAGRGPQRAVRVRADRDGAQSRGARPL